MPLTQDDLDRLDHVLTTPAVAAHVIHKKGWRNFSRNVNLPDATVLRIKTISVLQTIMRTVYELNANKQPNERVTVRVAAGGREDDKWSKSYSFTPGVEADIVIQLVGNEFRQIQTVDKEHHVYRLGASLQIGEVDKHLYDRGSVLPTSSLIPYVTVAGLSANAGHGSGKDQPGFAGLIKKMTLMLPNGDIKQIDETHPDFEAIRGAHLGMFGIVLDIEVQCAPAMKLQCVMEKRSLSEFLEEVKQGLFDRDYAVSVMYVPTYLDNELFNRHVKNVIIYRYNPVPISVNDSNHTPVTDRLSQGIQISVQEKFDIDDLLREHPSLLPYYLRYLVTRTTVGCQDQIEVGPWPMFHYQTAFPRSMNDMSFLFPVSDKGGRQEIIDAYTRFVQLLADHAKRGEYPVAYATYGRYFKGTKGGLSTSAQQPDEHMFGFDVVSLPGLKGFEEFRRNMSTYLIEHLRGRPHWGKYVPENINLAKMYDLEAFNGVLHRWYEANHLLLDHSPFINDFAARLLNRPDLVPVLPLSAKALSSEDLAKVVPVKELVKCTAACIKETDEDAIAFKKRLQMVAQTSKASNSRHSTFSSKHHEDKNDKGKQRAGSSRCPDAEKPRCFGFC